MLLHYSIHLRECGSFNNDNNKKNAVYLYQNNALLIKDGIGTWFLFDTKCNYIPAIGLLFLLSSLTILYHGFVTLFIFLLAKMIFERNDFNERRRGLGLMMLMEYFAKDQRILLQIY
jgi:hypothetical protein